MRHPKPRLDPLLAPGGALRHEFRPDPSGGKTWGATPAAAMWPVPLGRLPPYLAVVQPRDCGLPWLLAAPAGVVPLAIARAERAIARRWLRDVPAALTNRRLLRLAPDAEPRGIAACDIRHVGVVPGPGRLGTLHLRPAHATLPALPEAGAAARRITARAEGWAARWRDWMLARLAWATPDERALTLLRRPDLGLSIALPHERRVDGDRWTALRQAAPGWRALRAEGAACSRVARAVSARPAAHAQAAVLAAAARTLRPA